jgi:hypothetical protein
MKAPMPSASIGTLPETFETPRLLARLPVPSDAARIFASYATRPEVSRYMLWQPHLELSTTEAFVSECIAAQAVLHVCQMQVTGSNLPSSGR